MYCRSLPVYTALGVLRDIMHRSFQGWFSFLLECTQLKTDQVHFQGPVEKLLLAVPNRLQKAKGRFCSSQRWHPRPLGCDCLSQRFSNFRDHGPLLSLTGEYLIYRDTWVTQCHGRAAWWRPLVVDPRESLRWPPRGVEGPVWETLVLSNSQVSTFLGEGHISHCTTVRGRTSEVMWLFRDMLHSTKSTQFL